MAKTDYMIIFGDAEIHGEAVPAERDINSHLTAYFNSIRTGRESDE